MWRARSICEPAELHGVSLSSVGRFLELWRSKGDLRAAKFGGYKEYALKPHAERLTHWIAEQPDITLIPSPVEGDSSGFPDAGPI